MVKQPDMTSQQGSALPVGLILLVILTLLGVAGMNSSRMQLRIAIGTQNYEYASQAAEAGIHNALGSQTPSINLDTGNVSYSLPNSANDSASGEYRMQYITDGPVPSGGWTVGSVTARHFRIDSTATLASSGQSETHVQGLYLIAPSN